MTTWTERLRAAVGAFRAPSVRNAGGGWQSLLDMIGFSSAASGMAVTHQSAQRVSAVYACVNLIAGAIGTLPLPVYRVTETVPEKERDHPLFVLLNEQPTPLCSAMMFWDYVIGCKLLRGDGLAAIARNRANQVTELVPFDPLCTRIDRKGNRLRYFTEVADTEGNVKVLGMDQDDVLHLPGFGWDPGRQGNVRGMSVISHAAQQAIGNALAMDEYGGRFFRNGANPSVVIQSPGRMTPEQVDLLKSTWIEKYAGAQNSGKPMVLTEGLTATKLSLTAEDSQLLESRNFTVVEIARAFGVPPHMVGAMDKASSWGTGIEQMSIGFVQYSLQRHLTQIQQEINRKVFGISRYFVEFNVDGLLRGDADTQAKVMREAIGGSQGPGWMTPNEVRRLKNLPPLDGGDELYNPNHATNAPEDTYATEPALAA